MPPAIAGRRQDLTGNQPLETQVGQYVRNFYPQRIGDKLDAIGGHVAPTGLPICDNRARNRRANGLEPQRKFILGNPLPFTKVADAASDRIMDFWVHTWMAAPRVCRGECFLVWFSEFFGSSSPSETASAWLGAWFLVRSSFSSISLWRRVNS